YTSYLFLCYYSFSFSFFFFQAEDGIRDRNVTGVQTCALPIFTVSISDVDQFPPDDFKEFLLIRQNGLEFFDGLENLVIFVLDFVTLKSGEAAETHIQDCLRLAFRQVELLHQAASRRFIIL